MDDSWLTETVSAARQAGSDRAHVEFVSAEKRLPKNLAETLAAFANSTGGWVVCGVSEKDGYIPAPGFSARKARKEARRVCKTLKPVLRPRMSIVSFEGAKVLVIRVDELRQVEKPCHVAKSSSRAGSFLRTDEGTVPMAAYEADFLCGEQEQPRNDDALAKKSSASDLNADLVAAFLERQRELHPKVFKGKSDKKVLRELHVTRKNKGVTKPTLGGLVALGSFPQQGFPRLCIMFTAFPGTDWSRRCEDGSKFLDARTITGPAPSMLDEALAAVRANAPDLPLDAVREAVANAIMHRDYSPESRGYPIQMNLFADRLEVTSPGGLYGKATVGALGHTRLTSSRNQFLCAILETTRCSDGRDVAENRGSGFVSMRGQMMEAGLFEPRVENSPESFTVVLERPRMQASQDAVQRDGDTTTGRKTATPRRKPATKKRDVDGEIIAFLQEKGSASLKELREKLGLGRTAVTNHVNALIAEGKVEATEPDRSPKQRYRLL